MVIIVLRHIHVWHIVGRRRYIVVVLNGNGDEVGAIGGKGQLSGGDVGGGGGQVVGCGGHGHVGAHVDARGVGRQTVRGLERSHGMTSRMRPRIRSSWHLKM